jgi:hypothetical protein
MQTLPVQLLHSRAAALFQYNNQIAVYLGCCPVFSMTIQLLQTQAAALISIDPCLLILRGATFEMEVPFGWVLASWWLLRI